MFSKKTLEDLKLKALAEVDALGDLAVLKKIEKKYLGRKGELTGILRGLKNLPLGLRRKIGCAANLSRSILEKKIHKKQEQLLKSQKAEEFDFTEPGVSFQLGVIHLLTTVRRDIENFFTNYGFQVLEGPEVETDYYNFEALNMPADHPARDIWDTFYIKSTLRLRSGLMVSEVEPSKLLLRAHTSPMQIRVMEKHSPPLAVIVPGRVFRREATDARHEHTFDQLEGLWVSKQVTAANLKFLLHELFRYLFGKDVEIRLRPGYFPFTEPSFELVMSCPFCKKRGCRVCGSGWLEMLGAGMVHPRVFDFVGYGKKWRGFAFGLGIARVAMLKYGIPDIRMFYENDIRVMTQF